MKVAIFPGSFDPFTVGHASIVERGLPMFDRIVIGVGVNDKKRSFYTPAQRVEAIQKVYAHEPRIKVVAYNDLTIDLAREKVPPSFCVVYVRSRTLSTNVILLL